MPTPPPKKKKKWRLNMTLFKKKHKLLSDQDAEEGSNLI